METGAECDAPEAMEEVIMKEAKSYSKNVRGLETMSYQMSIFDTIPYKMQALQLVKYVDDADKGINDNKEYDKLMKAYKEQDLTKLEEVNQKHGHRELQTSPTSFLYNRNRNWVEKLKTILPDISVVVAVGAGAPAWRQRGGINLLRKAGYTVKPISK